MKVVGEVAKVRPCDLVRSVLLQQMGVQNARYQAAVALCLRVRREHQHRRVGVQYLRQVQAGPPLLVAMRLLPQDLEEPLLLVEALRLHPAQGEHRLLVMALLRCRARAGLLLLAAAQQQLLVRVVCPRHQGEPRRRVVLVVFQQAPPTRQ